MHFTRFKSMAYKRSKNEFIVRRKAAQHKTQKKSDSICLIVFNLFTSLFFFLHFMYLLSLTHSFSLCLGSNQLAYIGSVIIYCILTIFRWIIFFFCKLNWTSCCCWVILINKNKYVGWVKRNIWLRFWLINDWDKRKEAPECIKLFNFLCCKFCVEGWKRIKKKWLNRNYLFKIFWGQIRWIFVLFGGLLIG